MNTSSYHIMNNWYATITNCAFLHIKRFKFSNLLIFTIVFLFLLTLCLQDHLIHRFCPSHMSEHLWVKEPFLSLLQDSGTPSRLIPVTRYLFLHSVQNSKPIFSSEAYGITMNHVGVSGTFELKYTKKFVISCRIV